jgi:hypothetical protein
LSAVRSPGRRFGLELGIAAALAGALLLRRQHIALGGVTVGVGGVLLVLALAVPVALDPVARHWLAFASVIARIATPIVLTIIYFGLVTPFGLLRRTVGTSPLKRDRLARSYWVRRTAQTAEDRRARMERQF